MGSGMIMKLNPGKMKEGEEYFQETVYHNFPTHAMIIRGEKREKSGDVWHLIGLVLMITKRVCLNTPEGLVMVDIKDCKFGVKKVFRKIK